MSTTKWNVTRQCQLMCLNNSSPYQQCQFDLAAERQCHCHKHLSGNWMKSFQKCFQIKQKWHRVAHLINMLLEFTQSSHFCFDFLTSHFKLLHTNLNSSVHHLHSLCAPLRVRGYRYTPKELWCFLFIIHSPASFQLQQKHLHHRYTLNR